MKSRRNVILKTLTTNNEQSFQHKMHWYESSATLGPLDYWKDFIDYYVEYFNSVLKNFVKSLKLNQIWRHILNFSD